MKWQECLFSWHHHRWKSQDTDHSVIIDRSWYDVWLECGRTESPTNNSVKQVSIDKRLRFSNNVIKDDFADKITFDMLNSKERIAIGLKPEILEEMNAKLHPAEVAPTSEEQSLQRDPIDRNAGVVGWMWVSGKQRLVSWRCIRRRWNPQKWAKRQSPKWPQSSMAKVYHMRLPKAVWRSWLWDDYHRMKLFPKCFKRGWYERS